MRPGVLRRWLRFQTVGVSGTLVQLTSVAVLREALGLDVLVATAIAVEAAILHNFCWHRNWTWRVDDAQRRKPAWRQLCEYNLSACLLGLGANVALTGCYIRAFHLHYLPANLLAIGTLGLANFLTGEWLIFRPAAPEEKETSV